MGGVGEHMAKGVVGVALEWRTAGSVELMIDAPPEKLYTAITDVTSMSGRSDECRSASWLPGPQGQGQVGSRFRGRNQARLIRWSRVCEVLVADADQEFAFRTVPERFDLSRADSTTWRYQLTPTEGGTLVCHSYEITRLPRGPFKPLYAVLYPHHRDMRPAMAVTLQRLAADAGGLGSPSH